MTSPGVNADLMGHDADPMVTQVRLQAKNIWTPEFQLFDFKATPNFYNTTDTNIKTMSGQVHIYIARKCTTASRIFKGRSTVLIKL